MAEARQRFSVVRSLTTTSSAEWPARTRLLTQQTVNRTFYQDTDNLVEQVRDYRISAGKRSRLRTVDCVAHLPDRRPHA